MKISSAIVSASLLIAGPAYCCQADGVYGFAFGSKPSRLGEKLYGNYASVWYVAKAPEPDPRFDSYEVRLDTEKRELLEVVAVKKTYHLPADGAKYSPEEVKEGKRLSREFAVQFIATLPPRLQASLVDKYGAGNWEGEAEEGFHMSVSASTPYKVTVSCLDNKREWAIARRVMPELFKK
ncbi:hypothetical protein [Solimonas flava]|uniref:hypothetical protein n=1 Tax=Solimonas flava TaxID=415849 RepID=UPI0012B54B12|nr:hypothetical protein [Solimonas flava]